MEDPTRPHFERSALLTVDFQCDVLPGGTFSREGNGPVAVNLAALAHAFRSRNRPVIHVVRIYLEDGSNADLCRREKLRRGLPLFRPKSEGVQVAPELLPAGAPPLDEDLLLAGGVLEIPPLDRILYKPRFGSFYRTPLEALLRDLGVDTLVVGGSNYPNCPRTTLYEASERDFRLVALSDGLSLFTEDDHRQMEEIGVRVMTSREVETALSCLC
jgi:nicotinamidase-related amidase